jgi:hypothetical protein
MVRNDAINKGEMLDEELKRFCIGVRCYINCDLTSYNIIFSEKSLEENRIVSCHLNLTFV